MSLYEHGLLPLEDILACVGFSESTFWHTLKLWRETGDVIRVTYGLPGHPCMMHFDNVNYLIELVKHRLTWFLDELLDLLEANRFIAVHYTTIHQELVCVGISLKKLQKIAKERDEDKRADFVQRMSQYEAEEIGFINETLKDERTAFRRNGRSAKGVFVHSHCLSAVGLLTMDGMVACNIVEGSFNAAKFLDFLEHDVVCDLFHLSNLLIDSS